MAPSCCWVTPLGVDLGRVRVVCQRQMSTSLECLVRVLMPRSTQDGKSLSFPIKTSQQLTGGCWDIDPREAARPHGGEAIARTVSTKQDEDSCLLLGKSGCLSFCLLCSLWINRSRFWQMWTATNSFPSPLMCVWSGLSHVWLFVTLWTVAHQAPQSIGFSRQEYWSGLPFPSGDLPDPGIELTSLTSPVLAGRFLTTSATWKSLNLGLKGLDWDPTNSKQSPFQMLLLGHSREAEQKENYCSCEKIQLFSKWDWSEESEILRYKTPLLKEWQGTKWKDNPQNGRKYLQIKQPTWD